VRPKRRLNFLCAFQIGQKAYLGQLGIGEYSVEAAAVCQSAYVPVNIDQIEARESEAREGYSRHVGCRRILEHRQDVEAALFHNPLS
jgi:hypothetical protein